jgi:hypothetical protein
VAPPFKEHTSGDQSTEHLSERALGGVDGIRPAIEGVDPPRFYVAGLPAMVETVAGILESQIGVPETEILWEPFHGY